MKRKFACRHYHTTKKTFRAADHCSGYGKPKFAGAAPRAIADPLSPIACCKAYNFAKIGGQGQPTLRAAKIGIVSLGGQFLASDWQQFATLNGIPSPSVQIITVDGATQNPDPQGADVENQLDIQCSAAAYTYSTGAVAGIVVALAPNTGTGIADAIMALVKAGVAVISISWGAPESQWAASDRAVTEAALQAAEAAGITVCVASGDSSQDDGTNSATCDYPSGSANAVAVGGTTLVLNADGSRASESAWGDGKPGDEGGGGGFDPMTNMPSWQIAAVTKNYPGQLFRGSPDFAANADPNSGYIIVTGGQPTSVGGTSGSTPLLAGYFAAIKAGGASFSLPQPILYPLIGVATYDITTGSDGSPALVGYDDCTGCGSPNGPAMASALTGPGTLPPQPPQSPIPPQPPVTAPLFTITVPNVPKGKRVVFTAKTAMPAGVYGIVPQSHGSIEAFVEAT